LGNACDKRKAISGVTDLPSLMISEIALRETPSVAATFVIEISDGSKYKFLKIRPGWAGGRVLILTIDFPVLVIVDINRNIVTLRSTIVKHPFGEKRIDCVTYFVLWSPSGSMDQNDSLPLFCPSKPEASGATY
jgi:hypothetical protein